MIGQKAGCAASPSLQPARPSVSPPLRLAAVGCFFGFWLAAAAGRLQGLRAFASGRAGARLGALVLASSGLAGASVWSVSLSAAGCGACGFAVLACPLAMLRRCAPPPCRAARRPALASSALAGAAPQLASLPQPAQPLRPQPFSLPAAAALTPKAGSPPRCASAPGFRSGRSGFRSGLALHPAFFRCPAVAASR